MTEELNDKWYVNYTVRIDSSVIQPLLQCQAGPYTIDEINAQYMDIRGYVGVEQCYKTTGFDPNRLNPTTLKE